MKLLIDIDEHSKRGKLTLDLLKEMGIDAKEMPSSTDYAFLSNRKISSEELNYLLDEADVSENLILNEEIVKYKAGKK